MRATPVSESSQVAEARRTAADVANSLGLDEETIGRVSLVATELASNLIKHGKGGEILVSACDEARLQPGIQLIALDKGRGIANLQECLRDGYSTAGSAGQGLGAIKRQSSVMEVASWPDKGTAILVRVDGTSGKAIPAAHHGFVSVPKTGEEVCGDACAVVDTPAGKTLMVVDGLGHGMQAAIAAREAVRLFLLHQQLPVSQILEYLHAGLRATRGAAVAVARCELAQRRIVYGGIGNIAGTIVTPTETRRMISLNGTAGHVARRIQTFDYPYTGGTIIMHSDGLATHWSLDRYPGIHRMHPTLAAGVLYRDFSRGRDDVTVLVADPGART